MSIKEISYSVSNTEEIGILVEKLLCIKYDIKFQTNRNYDIREELRDDILELDLDIILKEHLGYNNKEIDFLTLNNDSVSIKTSISTNKICPSTIGQTTLQKILDYFKLDSIKDFKKNILEGNVDIIEEYLKNIYDCKYLVYFKLHTGDVYIFEKKDDIKLCGNLEINNTRQTLDEWKESNTFKINKVSLAEIQIHNNRNCIKSRFNIDSVIKLINTKNIKGISYKRYPLKKKYNIKVKKKSSITSMNYIGSKTKLLSFIESCMKQYTCKKSLSDVSSFLDLFSGTGSVGYYLLKNGCKNVISNDIQHYSYILSNGWTTKNIDKVKMKSMIREFNEIIPDPINISSEYFIHDNYSPYNGCERMYFTEKNAIKIDVIRQAIETNKEIITEEEYNFLLKVLLYSVAKVSNITSVYGAYLKKFKRCALNDLKLDDSILDELITDNVYHKCYNKDAIELLDDLEEVECCYIDPPYNSRNYSSNFHLLETVTLYDNPEITGKTGLRKNIDNNSKNFCIKQNIHNNYDTLFKNIKCKYVFMSYNSDGILSKSDIVNIMSKYFTNISVYECEYKKFISNKNTKNENILEYVFCGTKK